MKFKLDILLIVIGFTLLNCSVSTNAEEANISLPTIMCGMCETNIVDAFSKTDGVLKVKVDLENKNGKVFFNPQKVSLAQIETQISIAGYQANETMALKEAYNKLPRCCKING